MDIGLPNSIVFGPIGIAEGNIFLGMYLFLVERL